MTPASEAAAQDTVPLPGTHRIEVRLLGPTTVRRADGTVVSPREWRTSKTLDLLRLLALHRDRPVRTDRIVDLLWPDVEEPRGRASLRTAASQLRRVLHPECIERSVDGLVLRHAWVDVTSFRALAAEAAAARRSGQLARTVAAGWAAEGLYLRDFQAQDDESLWARDERSSLARLRTSVLVDASESAAELGWFRDALDLAARLVDLEPSHEVAHRVLMAGQAGLGRDDEALRTFERIRVRLDEELGSRPSQPTRELHARVVSGSPRPRATRPRVGNDAAADRLAALLVRTEDPLVICLVGSAGSGRDRLLEDACEQAGRRRRRHRVTPGGGWPDNVRQLSGSGSREERPPDEVVVARLEESSPAKWRGLLEDVLARPDPPRTLVVVCDSDFGATVGQYPYRAERVGVAPLCAAELAGGERDRRRTRPCDVDSPAERQPRPGRARVARDRHSPPSRAGALEPRRRDAH